MSLPFLHTPAKIIRSLMIDLGLGVDDQASDWSIYSSGEPDKPDKTLTVYDTTPKPDGRVMVTGETDQHWGIQVRIRAATPSDAFVKTEAIRVAFNESVANKQVNIGGNHYMVPCINTTSPIFMGKDTPATKRSVYTLNCTSPIYRIN